MEGEAWNYQSQEHRRELDILETEIHRHRGPDFIQIRTMIVLGRIQCDILDHLANRDDKT